VRPIDPYGGALVDLVADPERARELRSAAARWASLDLTDRQLCDLELLANGGFSPLDGFMGEKDHASVCETMRLADGTLWPIPVTLDVDPELARGLDAGSMLALRDPEGALLAALEVREVFRPDRAWEAEAVYGTASAEHPGAAEVLHLADRCCVTGRLEVVAPPVHHDFQALRRSPAELRRELTELGWDRVVAFQTRNPMHRAHHELTLRAARAAGAGLLLHPVVGRTRPGDVDHFTRVRGYQAVMPRYPAGTARLALLPLAMRMAGPREAVWHAIIRRNYGCTHLVVGRDHAGPGVDAGGRPFYDPYAAQQLVGELEPELGVGMVPFQATAYVPDLDAYLPEDEVPSGTRVLAMSGTEVRRRLAAGEELPGWFTFPEVAAELRRSYPARRDQGLVVFLCGLSGAGKSAIAGGLAARLLEHGGRAVTLLDGDLVRRLLSSELGFSKEHRDLNVRRIAFVAAAVARSGGAAICAQIAPYDAARREARAMVRPTGGFVLVHVATPLEVCEARDRKGLYAKARAGVVDGFTGISDPFEPPTDAEVVVDTSGLTVGDAVQLVVDHLQAAGYLPA
jgi:sulfate adenylyltransferase